MVIKDNKYFKNIVYGFIIGDALGVPVEFTKRFILNEKPVLDMRSGGIHRQSSGTWSDDTSMSLCLFENYKEKGNYLSLSNKFLDFKNNGYLTPDSICFDIGGAVEKALINIENGVEPVLAGSLNIEDNGNGSLMRIFPVAFYKDRFSSELDFIKEIENISSITHRHSVSKLACIIYCVFLYYLILNKSKNNDNYSLSMKSSVLKQTEEYLYSFVFPYNNEYLSIFKEYFLSVFQSTFPHLNRDAIKSSSYVVDSLFASIYSFLVSDSFSTSVLFAVNLGLDTDTIGALTGCLAASFYELDNDEQYDFWKNKLKRKDIIDTVLN